MLQYPEPEDNWQELKVGDRASVKREVPVYSGRVGTIIEIDEAGMYTLEFADGSTMTYDGDMLRKVNKLPGRPVVFEQTERFNLRELSSDIVEYIDSTKGNLTRRARLEEIVRENMLKQSNSSEGE